MDGLLFDVLPEGLHMLPLHLFTEVMRRVKINDMMDHGEGYRKALRKIIKGEVYAKLDHLDMSLFTGEVSKLMRRTKQWVKGNKVAGTYDLRADLMVLCDSFSFIYGSDELQTEQIFNISVITSRGEDDLREELYAQAHGALISFLNTMLELDEVHGVRRELIVQNVDRLKKWVITHVYKDVVQVFEYLNNIECDMLKKKHQDGRDEETRRRGIGMILNGLNYKFSLLNYTINQRVVTTGEDDKQAELYLSGGVGTRLLESHLNQSVEIRKSWVNSTVECICGLYWQNIASEVANYTNYGLKELTTSRFFEDENTDCTNIRRYEQINQREDLKDKVWHYMKEDTTTTPPVTDNVESDRAFDLNSINEHAFTKLVGISRRQLVYKRVFIEEEVVFQTNGTKELHHHNHYYQQFLREKIQHLVLVVGDYGEIKSQLGGETTGLEKIDDILLEITPKCSDIVMCDRMLPMSHKEYDLAVTTVLLDDTMTNKKVYKVPTASNGTSEGPVIEIPPKLGSLINLFMTNTASSKSLLTQYARSDDTFRSLNLGNRPVSPMDGGLAWVQLTKPILYNSEEWNTCIKRKWVHHQLTKYLKSSACPKELTLLGEGRAGDDALSRSIVNFVIKKEHEFDSHLILGAMQHSYALRLENLREQQLQNSMVDDTLLLINGMHRNRWAKMIKLLGLGHVLDAAAEALFFGIGSIENENCQCTEEGKTQTIMGPDTEGGGRSNPMADNNAKKTSLTGIKKRQLQKLIQSLSITTRSPYVKASVRNPLFNDVGLERLCKIRHNVVLGKKGDDGHGQYYLCIGNKHEYGRYNEGTYFTHNGKSLPCWLRTSFGGPLSEEVKYYGIETVNNEFTKFSTLWDYFVRILGWNSEKYLTMAENFNQTTSEWKLGTHRDMLYFRYLLEEYYTMVMSRSPGQSVKVSEETTTSSSSSSSSSIDQVDVEMDKAGNKPYCDYFRSIIGKGSSGRDEDPNPNVIHGVKAFCFLDKREVRKIMKGSSGDQAAGSEWRFQRRGMLTFTKRSFRREMLNLNDATRGKNPAASGYYTGADIQLHRQFNNGDRLRVRMSHEDVMLEDVKLRGSVDSLCLSMKSVKALLGQTPNMGLLFNDRKAIFSRYLGLDTSLRLPWWFCECKHCLTHLFDLFCHQRQKSSDGYKRSEVAWFYTKGPNGCANSSHILAFVEHQLSLLTKREVMKEQHDGEEGEELNRRIGLLWKWQKKYTRPNDGVSLSDYHRLTCAELAIQHHIKFQLSNDLLEPIPPLEKQSKWGMRALGLRLNNTKLDVATEDVIWTYGIEYYKRLDSTLGLFASVSTAPQSTGLYESTKIHLGFMFGIISEPLKDKSVLCAYLNEHMYFKRTLGAIVNVSKVNRACLLGSGNHTLWVDCQELTILITALVSVMDEFVSSGETCDKITTFGGVSVEVEMIICAPSSTIDTEERLNRKGVGMKSRRNKRGGIMETLEETDEGVRVGLEDLLRSPEILKIMKIESPYNTPEEEDEEEEEKNTTGKQSTKKTIFSLTLNYMIFVAFLKLKCVIYDVLDKYVTNANGGPLTEEEKIRESMCFLAGIITERFKIFTNTVGKSRRTPIDEHVMYQHQLDEFHGCVLNDSVDRYLVPGNEDTGDEGYRNSATYHRFNEHTKPLVGVREDASASTARNICNFVESVLVEVRNEYLRDDYRFSKPIFPVGDDDDEKKDLQSEMTIDIGKSVDSCPKPNRGVKRRHEEMSTGDVSMVSQPLRKKSKTRSHVVDVDVEETYSVEDGDLLILHVMEEIRIRMILTRLNRPIPSGTGGGDTLGTLNIAEEYNNRNGSGLLDLPTGTWFVRHEDYESPYTMAYKESVGTTQPLNSVLEMITNFIQ